MDDVRRRDKFVGSLLGTMVGDSLGEPIEEWPCAQLNAILDARAALGSPDWQAQQVIGLLAGVAVGRGEARYTDDTQMAIGVAQALVEDGEIIPAHLARHFADNFQPWRGYGSAAYGVLDALQNGFAWDVPAKQIHEGQGSYGNGAAMRVAPLGAFLWNAEPAEIYEQARLQSLPTHIHPQGIAGAQLLAHAVALATRFNHDKNSFAPQAFLDALLAQASESVYIKQLETIGALLEAEPDRCVVAQRLGNAIYATLSVPAAIFSFLARHDSFTETVQYALRLGGDADTIGAMAGGLAGAFHGASAIPKNWLEALENGPQGRDFVCRLGDKLFNRTL